jgi:putative aminopeptidase FrvX
MKILHEVCSLPTAPFVEDRVVAYARAFAKARKLKFNQDCFGNVLLELRGSKRNAPRWVYTAHMDHPGFVADRMLDATTLQATFRGWVLAEYAQGQNVRFFVGDTEIPGTVIDVKPEKKSQRAERVTIRVKAPVPPKTAGMFDLHPARVKGGQFHSRAIDDL